MERERLDLLIRDPQSVGPQDLSVLKELVERSPWFSGAHLLRAVGERGTGDVRSDQTLQSTSAHLPSRAVLYDLVERPLPRPSVTITQHIRVLEDTTFDELKEPSRSPNAEASSLTTPLVDPFSDVTNDESTSTSDPLLEPSPREEEDPLERQILEAALASAYDLSLYPAPTPIVTPDPVIAASTVIPAAPVAPTPAPVPGRTDTIGERRSRMRFSDWLNEAPDPTPVPPGQHSTSLNEQVVYNDAGIEPGSSAPEVPAPRQSGTGSNRDLIDRFIQHDTPAPTRRTEFFTPQQAAKRSLDDTAGLVTETLARIYEKQGNLTKAIEAYRKLALKYPEKSAYFGALSRSLEEQLNK